MFTSFEGYSLLLCDIVRFTHCDRAKVIFIILCANNCNGTSVYVHLCRLRWSWWNESSSSSSSSKRSGKKNEQLLTGKVCVCVCEPEPERARELESVWAIVKAYKKCSWMVWSSFICCCCCCCWCMQNVFFSFSHDFVSSSFSLLFARLYQIQIDGQEKVTSDAHSNTICIWYQGQWINFNELCENCANFKVHTHTHLKVGAGLCFKRPFNAKQK